MDEAIICKGSSGSNSSRTQIHHAKTLVRKNIRRASGSSTKRHRATIQNHTVKGNGTRVSTDNARKVINNGRVKKNNTARRRNCSRAKEEISGWSVTKNQRTRSRRNRTTRADGRISIHKQILIVELNARRTSRDGKITTHRRRGILGHRTSALINHNIVKSRSA